MIVSIQCDNEVKVSVIASMVYGMYNIIIIDIITYAPPENKNDRLEIADIELNDSELDEDSDSDDGVNRKRSYWSKRRIEGAVIINIIICKN